MPIYLISENNEVKDEVNTPVFDVANAEGGSAIAVFSAAECAQRYISEAGWMDQQIVVAINNEQLENWLATAKDRDVSHVALDPVRKEHVEKDRPVMSWTIEDPVLAAREILDEVSTRIRA